MSKTFRILIGLLISVVLLAPAVVWADPYLENLKEGQKIDGFSVTSIYENGVGKAMGARFISDKYGFIVDLLRIESVPQAYMWVKTPPDTDFGDPHWTEHLVLAKGSLGRYVNAMDDMSLATSTAATGGTITQYHFNTVAGSETFFKLLDARMEILLKPTYTDEEIHREGFNIGVDQDPQTGALSLEEKGTVYTEMVSAFESPYSPLFKKIGETLYGPDHPLANSSGGYPPAMRKAKPEDQRKFHKKAYYLGNMGMIASIPDDISVELFLKKMAAILDKDNNSSVRGNFIGMTKFDYPPAKMAQPVGRMEIVDFASENPQDPSVMLFIWPPTLEYDNFENVVLDHFLSTFGSDNTSNLYNLLINSQTRKLDLGASGTYAYSSTDLGHPITIWVDGVKSDLINEKMMDSVRGLIIDEIGRVYNYKDGSAELTKFNNIAKGFLIQSRKQYEKYLNTPPMFGFRTGPASGWFSVMEFLENEKSFRKSLILKTHFENLEKLLDSGKNFWKEYINHWNLLAVKPYGFATKPDPSLIQKTVADKTARMAGYIAEFKKKYGVTSDSAAIAKYKQEFDRKSAELDSIAAKEELPTFIDNPPMTLDDQLKYEVIKLNNGVNLVASTFENMTSATLGLALRLNVVPESLLVYVAALPTVLSDIGVIKDGKVIKYDEMQNRLREDVLDYNAYFSFGAEKRRVELVLKGSGNNRAELNNVLDWMNASLYSPYLDTANLAYMVDNADQSLVDLRNTMKGQEEHWVTYPSRAYRFQDNPLIMSVQCFLTKMHDIQRLRWLLTDPGNETDQKNLAEYIDNLAKLGQNKGRTELAALLDNPPAAGASEKCQKIAADIISTLKSDLADIPDPNLAGDWIYLLNEIKKDLMVPPAKALANIKYVLNLICKSDNARMFMISNSADRLATMEKINSFADRLDSKAKSQRVEYAKIDRIIEHMKSREGNIARPIYAGLVNENSRNGVMMFGAKNAEILDTTREAMLGCLSGKLYSGYGGHGFFTKTINAGLAYSNGYGYDYHSGRAGYYAERCPDIAKTMRFVVDIVKTAENNPKLADYAIAQSFQGSRAPDRYESRGEAMASDLADGFTPEREKDYRQRILKLRKEKNLYQELVARMPKAYGTVFIGYGEPKAKSREGNFFIIGPDQQFQSLEDYIKTVEGPQKIYRLYPRDFWLTN